MRLWRIWRSNNPERAKYVGIDDSQETYTLHLYRALLRQCSYLPDEAARQYCHRHVVSRFRDYHPRTFLQTLSRHKKQSRLVEQRHSALLKTGRQGLQLLRRANDGHPRHLGKILAMTYGRIGKRRHELLAGLRIPDTPTDQTALSVIASPSTQGLPQPSRKLQALLKSQAFRKLSFFSRSTRPSLEPNIPAKNAWGRPMPIKRVRNFKRRWYGETLDLIMPPLPETEWNRLRRLASGESPWNGPVARRGLREQDRVKGEIVRGTLTGGTGFFSSPHNLTGRHMRRLLTKIFAQCPLMKPDDSRRLGWEVRWGDVQSTKEVGLRSNDQERLSMFEGVDEKGKILRSANIAWNDYDGPR